MVTKRKAKAASPKKAYNDTQKNIPLEDLVNNIKDFCEYKFSVVDYNVDEELISLARAEGIDLNGYKHIVENDAARHSYIGHELSVDDYLLIPYIIRNREQVRISDKLTGTRKQKAFIYRKTIGDEYVYVEEIRNGKNKSLAFQTLYKRKIKTPPKKGGVK